jgi:hypothetical protein
MICFAGPVKFRRAFFSFARSRFAKFILEEKETGRSPWRAPRFYLAMRNKN